MATSSKVRASAALKPSVAVKTSSPIELMPGAVALGLTGQAFKTLLGSCICAVLTDPRRTVAALSHIVYVGQPTAAKRDNPAYGAVAMERMFALLRARGVNPGLCEAYVFGGGNMFPQIFETRHVGRTNADWVMDYLHHHGIAVIAHDVGGTGYRKLTWSVGRDDPVVEIVFPEQGVSYGG
jgi:chemotaxis protein CheD